MTPLAIGLLFFAGYALYDVLVAEDPLPPPKLPELPAPNTPGTPTPGTPTPGTPTPGTPTPGTPTPGTPGHGTGEEGEVDPNKHHDDLVKSVKARLAELGFALDETTSMWIETMTDEDLVCLLGVLGQDNPDNMIAAGKACVTGSVSSHRVEYFATAVAMVLRDTGTPVKPIKVNPAVQGTITSPGWPSPWGGKPSEVPNLRELPQPLQQAILAALQSGNAQTLETIATSVRMLGFPDLADYLLTIAEQFRGGL